MSDKVYVGQKVQSFESKGEYEPFSRVTMWYDDEHCYTAGDDTGRTLECENPWATQQIVDNVLKQVKGYVYRPFEAKGVELDMAAELGDGVTVCGTYSVLGHITRHMDALGLCDIGAPGEKEINHEYPYKSPQDRELKRRVKLGQNYFGTKITRKDGLVIENVDDKTNEVLATAVLNANILAFYKGQSRKEEDAQLYFDSREGCFKFCGALNVNDNFMVDKFGNVTLNGSIKWGVGNQPNKKRYAASTSGPWRDTMQSGDIYCCDWDYTAEKWGEAYKFVGIDGRPGSDASVPGYIKSTYIDMTGVTAPYIKANLMTVQTPDQSKQVMPTECGFLLTGYFDSAPYEWLKISYFEGDGPNININSPDGAAINLGSYQKSLSLLGNISFASANSIYWGDNAPVAVFA